MSATTTASSAATSSADARLASAPPHSGLEVSRYDQVAGSLLSILVVMSVLTAAMFLIWLSNRKIRIPAAAPVQMLEDVGGGGFGDSFTPGMQQEFTEPTDAELPSQQAVESMQVTADSIAALTGLVSTEGPTLDALESYTGGHGRGSGTGMGDGRGPGPGGPGTSDGIPAWERWEVRMQADRIEEYSKILDYFQVELGVAGGGSPHVEYITTLSAAKPKVRVGAPKDERRLRFMHRSGQLREADKQLAAKAGVNTKGRVVFQFYSQPMYDTLLRLEHAKMGKRRIREIKQTVFGVRKAGDRYEFYVISQAYRSGV